MDSGIIFPQCPHAVTLRLKPLSASQSREGGSPPAKPPEPRGPPATTVGIVSGALPCARSPAQDAFIPRSPLGPQRLLSRLSYGIVILCPL